MLDLYTWATPNGRKISIVLEELGVDYRVHPIDIMKDEQFNPAFLALNPNNKIPVIIDEDGPEGKPLTLFESGAILIYLVEKYKSALLPEQAAPRLITLQWLMFQMGGVGPMFGQLHHFRRYVDSQEYSLTRYEKEVHRIYGVLNNRLGTTSFLNGDGYSIADIATYPWVSRHSLHNLDWAKFPHVARWFESVGQRPAVIRGMAVPKPQ
jgi:GSH-dependent disulfide-bond oxidoreductase